MSEVDESTITLEKEGFNFNIVKDANALALNTGAPVVTVHCEDIDVTLHNTPRVVTIQETGPTVDLSSKPVTVNVGKFIPSTPIGETNTAANVGTGAELFRDKIGAELNFRTLRGEAGITVAEDGDEVVISGGNTFERVVLPNVPGDTWTAVPLATLSAEIRDYRFYDENGNRIYLASRLANDTTLEVCASSDLTNITVFISGI